MISRRWLDNVLSSQKGAKGHTMGPHAHVEQRKVSILARRVMVVINEVVIDLD